MRKILLSLFVGCILFGFSFADKADAATTYYSFEGTITTVTNNTGSAYPFDVGDTLQYIFSVNYEKSAWKMNGLGEITYGWYDGPYENFFETNNLTGQYITDEFYPEYYDENYGAELHYGDETFGYYIGDQHYGYYRDSVLFASGSESIQLAIDFTDAGLLADLSTGTVGHFMEYAQFRIDGHSVVDIVEGNVRITNISQQNPLTTPVPLPSAIFLLGSSLAGLAGLRKKMKT